MQKVLKFYGEIWAKLKKVITNYGPKGAIQWTDKKTNAVGSNQLKVRSWGLKIHKIFKGGTIFKGGCPPLEVFNWWAGFEGGAAPFWANFEVHSGLLTDTKTWWWPCEYTLFWICAASGCPEMGGTPPPYKSPPRSCTRWGPNSVVYGVTWSSPGFCISNCVSVSRPEWTSKFAQKSQGRSNLVASVPKWEWPTQWLWHAQKRWPIS